MSTQIAVWSAAAVLVCWCLGAYNRLVRLREASVVAFRDFAELLAARHRLVGEWLAAARPEAAVEGDGSPWFAADAACRQAQAAVDHAAAAPAAAAPLASLALAEQLLQGALAQWSANVAAPAPPDDAASVPAPVGAAAAVTATNVPLGLARDRYNAAAAAYDLAARQFPTRIVAWLFGFHAAGRV